MQFFYFRLERRGRGALARGAARERARGGARRLVGGGARAAAEPRRLHAHARLAEGGGRQHTIAKGILVNNIIFLAKS